MDTGRRIAVAISHFSLACAALLLALPVALAQSLPQRPMSKIVFPAKPKTACIVPTPGISISPASFSFPSTAPGMSSSPQSFTISNPGTAPLSISGIFPTPPLDPDYFNVSGACGGATVPPGGSCVGDVTFQAYGPAGSRSQTIQVYSNAPGSPHAISASGIVGPSAPMPGYSRSPSGTVFVGSALPLATSTPPVSITITNTGSAPLNIIDPGTAPAPFNLSNGCTAPVAPSGSCSMTFTMTGSASPGSEFGTVSIIHDAPGSPDTVDLAGNTIDPNPDVEFSPPGAYLGAVTVGSVASSGVDVKNRGGAPLTIASVSMLDGTQGFSITLDNCTSQVLAPNATCRIDFDFTPPTTVGYYSDSINVVSNAPSSPSQFSVAADSVNPMPNLTISPSFHDFLNQNVSAPPVCVLLTLNNLDAPAAPATNLSYLVYGDASFTLSTVLCPTTCGAVVPGGTSCMIGIDFDPTFTGPQYGYLQVYDANSFAYYYADAQGVGVQPGPVIALDQAFIDFGSQLTGTRSPPQTVTVSNTGDANLLVSSVSVSPPFTLQSETCTAGPVMPPPAPNTCTITTVFDAPATGSYFQTAFITSDAVSGPSSFDLYGTSTGAPVPSIDFFPESLDFGNVVIPQTSVPRSVSFANNGAAPLSISSITVSGEFTLAHDCPLSPATMAPGVCCSMTSQFAPTIIGPASDNITITTDAAGSPHRIALTANAVPPPSLTPSPAGLMFAAVVGTNPPPQDVVLVNTGIQNIMFTGFSVGGEFYLYDPLAPPSLAAPAEKGRFIAPTRSKAGPMPNCFSVFPTFDVGQACYIKIWWAPTFVGPHSTNLVVNFANGTGAPLMVPLSGASLPASFPQLSLSADTMTFSGVINQASVTQSLTVSNTGTAPLSITGVSAFGPFRIVNGCPALLDAGRSCVVDVTYHSTRLGRETGDLFIEHNAGGGFRQIQLLGEGIPVPLPKIALSSNALGFGSRVIGAVTNATSRLVVHSVGTAPLEIGAITATPGFSVASACPAVLLPNRECAVDVTFKPGGTGKIVGTLSISSNDPDRPHVPVSLEGTGCRVLSVTASRSGARACGP